MVACAAARCWSRDRVRRVGAQERRRARDEEESAQARANLAKQAIGRDAGVLSVPAPGRARARHRQRVADARTRRTNASIWLHGLCEWMFFRSSSNIC